MRSKIPKELLDELALLLGFCFECGGKLRNVDGEVVCEKCRHVWGYENVDESIPFPEGENEELDRLILRGIGSLVVAYAS